MPPRDRDPDDRHQGAVLDRARPSTAHASTVAGIVADSISTPTEVLAHGPESFEPILG